MQSLGVVLFSRKNGEHPVILLTNVMEFVRVPVGIDWCSAVLHPVEIRVAIGVCPSQVQISCKYGALSIRSCYGARLKSSLLIYEILIHVAHALYDLEWVS